MWRRLPGSRRRSRWNRRSASPKSGSAFHRVRFPRMRTCVRGSTFSRCPPPSLRLRFRRRSLGSSGRSRGLPRCQMRSGRAARWRRHRTISGSRSGLLPSAWDRGRMPGSPVRLRFCPATRRLGSLERSDPELLERLRPHVRSFRRDDQEGLPRRPGTAHGRLAVGAGGAQRAAGQVRLRVARQPRRLVRRVYEGSSVLAMSFVGPEEVGR